MLKNQEQIALFMYGVIASLLSVAESKGVLKEEITALSEAAKTYKVGLTQEIYSKSFLEKTGIGRARE